MPTFLQLKKTRPARKKKTRVRQLRECPQKRGVCHKLFIMTPRKPNSAKRRVAKIKLCTKKFVFGYIPGEGNNLQKYSHVLIRGGLIRDLPGVHYTIIRGKLDLHSILYRRQGRSKYGTKIWWTPKKKERMSAQAVYKKTILEQIQGYLIYNNTRYSRLCLAQACKRLALDFLLTAPNGIVQARYVNDIQTLFARRIVEIHESLQQAHLRYLVKNNLINQQILKNPKEQYLFFLKLRTTPQHLLIPPKKVFPDSKQKKNFGASLNSAQNIQKTKHHASFQGTTSKRNFCTYSNGQLKKANCFLAFTKQFSSVISFKANNFVFFFFV